MSSGINPGDAVQLVMRFSSPMSARLGMVALGVVAALVGFRPVAVAQPTGAPSARPSPGPGAGQVPTGPPDTVSATLAGVVFDSTRSAVLSGARVALVGTAATATTDAEGGFRLSGIPPGEYSVTFHHPRLQHLGVSPAVRMVTLRPGAETRVRLSIPSRPTILRGWCALEGAPPGTAHVGGVVTDSLTGVPLPNARVELGRAGEDDPLLEIRTDDQGRYRFCGVTEEGWMSLRVRFGTQATSPIAVRAGAGSGTIEDFSLGLSHEVRVTGTVLDRETLTPVAGAHVRIPGADAEAMTDPDGTFGFSGLPPGRHVLVTRNLGYQERVDTLTVFSREALGVEVRLSTEPIPLEPLVVVGRSRDRAPEMPGPAGRGTPDMTRSEIEAVLHRTSDAGDLLRLSNIPGLSVRRVTYRDGGFVLPGLCVELSRSRRVAPETCAMVGVYVDGVHLPAAEYALQDLNHLAIERIQVLSPLEAAAAYGAAGRNGVLLLYTR